MPRPLIVVFVAFAVAGIGLVVWLFVHPPAPKQVALELRRSPPAGSFTHDVVHAALVDVPSPLPPYTAPACVAGVVVEGGKPAQERLNRALQPLCELAERPGTPADVVGSIRALATAKIRFALFTRTGELSTADLAERRILLAVALSRTNVPAGLIAPLLVHEGYHLGAAAPVTAAQEFGARRAEFEACEALFPERNRFPRGCDDAEAVVRLGEERAVELLVRAGYPR